MTIDSVYPDSTLAKQELLQAITYFIDRQVLVAHVISNLGLNAAAIGTYGPGAWSWNPQQNIAALRHELEMLTRPELYDCYLAGLRAHELRVPQQGVWHDQQGQEWNYYLHGTGCQITNGLTLEVIDWDCPNVAAFDPFFFEAHLTWQLISKSIPYQLVHLRSWITQNGVHAIQHLIEQLIDTGAITRDMTLA